VTLAVRRASAPLARAQGRWIAAIEPWRGLGYSGAGLGRFLARAAGASQAWVAISARRRPLGVMVLQPGVLLGSFVALLAVRPEAAGQGVGRALVAEAESEAFAARRWLYVSADSLNRAALAFYRKLGFRRVATLPDMVRPGRDEILLRKAKP
jgi:ribosomal protein S18 acetylase RimI-like enzyme